MKIDKTKMAAAALFSVSHKNGQYPKTYIYTRYQGN